MTSREIEISVTMTSTHYYCYIFILDVCLFAFKKLTYYGNHISEVINSNDSNANI